MRQKLLRSPVALSFLLVLAPACSGSTAGVGGSSSGSSGSSGSGAGTGDTAEALFDAPEGEATPGSIFGVWGGSMEDGGVTFDTRFRFEEDAISLATRCSLRDGRESETVGVTARARVSDEEITFLESKKDEKRAGDLFCRVNAQPRTLPACEGREGFERDCFRLAGTTLTIYGTPLEQLELVKLSD